MLSAPLLNFAYIIADAFVIFLIARGDMVRGDVELLYTRYISRSSVFFFAGYFIFFFHFALRYDLHYMTFCT